MSTDMLTLTVRLRLGELDLDVDEGLALEGVTALFGPSGGGKTTLLRIIAGLENRAGGKIGFDGETWADSRRGLFLPTHRRPVGFVFQDARLFSHLDVAGNLRFADRRSRGSDGAISFDSVLDALDLEPLLSRRVGGLSGGERQRVALGRTLLARPRLLLLDEPLSALDIGRKADILPYLEAAPRRYGVPTIFVSHSVEEVSQLANEVVVLADGRVQTRGPAAAVLERLDLQSITGRFEAGVLLETRVVGHDPAYHLTQVDLEGQILTMPMVSSLAAGDVVRLRVRARDVAIATVPPQGISIRNIVSGVIREIEAETDTAFAEVLIAVGDQRLRARITRQSVAELGLAADRPVYGLIKSVSFDRRVLGHR